MEKHHKWGPSRLPLLAQCLHFEMREEMKGMEEAAEWGTDIHSAFAAEFGAPMPENVLLDDDRMVDVQWAARKVRDWVGAQGELVPERTVQIIGPDFEILSHGTADLVDLKNRSLWDLKTGWTKGHEEQFAAYALGIMQEMGWECMTVVALYSKYREEQRRIWTILQAEEVVYDLFRKLEKGGPPTVCDVCRLCQKQLECESFANVTGLVGVNLSEEAAGIQSWQIDSLVKDPKKLAVALRLGKMLTSWAKELNAIAKEMVMERGINIPGFGLVKRRGNASVEQTYPAIGVLGLEPSAVLALAKLSMANWTALYQEKYELTKAGAKRDLEAKLTEANLLQRGADITYLRGKGEGTDEA